VLIVGPNMINRWEYSEIAVEISVSAAAKPIGRAF
jgi:hypothetical protein